MMHIPLYTALTASALLIIHVILMARVMQQRGKHEVLLGDGGVQSLLLAIRAHSNLLENAPIFLIGLGLLEMIVGGTLTVAILAGVFLLARIIHAMTFSESAEAGMGRIIGTAGTLLPILAVAGYLGYLSVMALWL